MIQLLKNAVKMCAVCFALALTANAMAEDRVVAMWTCELGEGKTPADVQEANGRWVSPSNRRPADCQAWLAVRAASGAAQVTSRILPDDFCGDVVANRVEGLAYLVEGTWIG